jgi:putative ubiquitin-RnfH superfamily antitoxin RatB of RatAB toxin-antitoxin module
MTGSEPIQVQLVCAWPDRAHSYRARVPQGTTAGQLVMQSRVLERFPRLGVGELQLAVFGRRVDAEYVLAPGDRVEVLRPLKNDPKETRRRRAAASGR